MEERIMRPISPKDPAYLTPSVIGDLPTAFYPLIIKMIEQGAIKMVMECPRQIM